MYDVIYKPINKKKFPALYVIIQNKQKTNNMNYNNKTILLALATTTASAVKLRSQNIFGDIADYTNEAILKPVGNAFEDAGEWVEGAVEDVGEATVDAFNTITDFGNDLVLAVDEDVTVALDEMNTAFTDIGNFANDIFLDPNLMPDLAYDIETGIIDPTDEMQLQEQKQQHLKQLEQIQLYCLLKKSLCSLQQSSSEKPVNKLRLTYFITIERDIY